MQLQGIQKAAVPIVYSLDLLGRLEGGLKRKVCGLGNQVTPERSHGGRGSGPSTWTHTSTWQES